MTSSSPLRERLRRRTGEAARRQAAVERRIAERRDGPPAPGELYVLAETAELPVEWAVLDRDAADPRRLLLVPADAGSLAGSADVAVDGARGALILRCGLPVWTDARALDPGLRTGFLAPEDVERARLRRAAVERGAVAGSVLAREVDGEAEYRRWLEVVEEARAAVPEPPPARVVRFRGRGPWGSTPGLLAIAASVLLALTLGLLGGRAMWIAEREHREAVAAQRDELARLERERRHLEESHRRDLDRLDDERRRAEAERDRRIAELEAELAAAARPRALVNLPLVILAAGQVRSGDDAIEVPPDASHLVLILQLDDPDAYRSYRLEVLQQASGRRVWRSGSGLVPSRLSELTVLLPRPLVPDGSYRLRLTGLSSDGTEGQVMERALTVESRSGQTRSE